MTRVRKRGEEVRAYILDQLEKHPHDVGALTARRFSISRQAVNKHLQNLVSEGAITPAGATRDRTYKLRTLQEWRQVYGIEPRLAEDVIWTRDVLPALGNMAENVREIWYYCFTEMANNAIDHSGSSEMSVHIVKTAANTQLALRDSGVGIFKKIETAMSFGDERHAILELSKGKLTTDPEKHTGQGLFFTSRLLDSFDILSGGVYFSHVFGEEEEDWILERPEFHSGTAVFMKLNNHTARTAKAVFDQYSSKGDFGFIKTVVPVKLARYGNDQLISRSQAKRVLARVELFRTVVLDFEDVPVIGQAFADEVFRVFARAHPKIDLVVIHANSDVKRRIAAARP